MMLAAEGRSSGFDYLRVVLALSVLGWHSLVTSYGPGLQAQIWAGPWRSIVAMILPMFFALSGFLVAASLQRNTLPTFLGLRVLRIVPALAVEIALSALVLGPLLTSGRLADYFSDSRFFDYLLNVTGNIHYFLPGVFEGNPFPHYVNAQLWTVPFELECYLLLALAGILGIRRRPGLLVFATIVLLCVWAGRAVLTGHDDGGIGSTVPGAVLVLCFLTGVAFYLMRDRIPASAPFCAVAAALAAVAFQVPFGDYLVPIPIAYLTVFLGLLNPRKRFLLRWGDYSYGIFLYGFPIEQLVASQGAAFQQWHVNLLIAVPLTVAFAALSWSVVERPALSLRGQVRKLDAVSRLTATAIARAGESLRPGIAAVRARSR